MSSGCDGPDYINPLTRNTVAAPSDACSDGRRSCICRVHRLNLQFATSLRIGLNGESIADEPMAGDLFEYRREFRGLRVDRFRQE